MSMEALSDTSVAFPSVFWYLKKLKTILGLFERQGHSWCESVSLVLWVLFEGSCWVAGACHVWSGLRWGCQVPLPQNGHRLRQSANPSKLRNRRLVICWHTIELGFLCILEKLTMPNVSWDVTSLTCLIKLSQKLENFFYQKAFRNYGQWAAGTK